MEIALKKIAIIGAGNLGRAIALGISNAGLVKKEQIIMTRKRKISINGESIEGINVINNNIEAVKKADLVFLCIQPKQSFEVLSEISEYLKDDQALVSVVTGLSIDEIRNNISSGTTIIRAMPNTAIAINSSMTCIATNDSSNSLFNSVQDIFKELGDVLVVNESMMQASTVLAASGIAFFMRYLRAATQGGIQMGFHPEEAQKIAVQTAKGAAELIQSFGSHPEVEIDKVTTPMGCTIEGLNEMEHQGFSSSLIKGLMTSYHKINSIK